MSTTATTTPIGADALVERTAAPPRQPSARVHAHRRAPRPLRGPRRGRPQHQRGAGRAGLVDERYARECLEQQAVAGVLANDDLAAPAAERRYSVPAEHREPLLDRDSLLRRGHAPANGRGVRPDRADGRGFDGEGVPYSEYGVHAREGIAAFNRPMFVTSRAVVVPGRPGGRGAPARDPARQGRRHRLRAGWSSVSIARGYLPARGRLRQRRALDPGRPALAAEQGVQDRVRFFVQDASDPGLEGTY